MKWNLWNRIDTSSTFATTLEWSRLFVAPIFNIFDATWIRRLPQALVNRPERWSKSGTLKLGISDHDLVYIKRKQSLPRPQARLIESHFSFSFSLQKLLQHCMYLYGHANKAGCCCCCCCCCAVCNGSMTTISKLIWPLSLGQHLCSWSWYRWRLESLV